MVCETSKYKFATMTEAIDKFRDLSIAPLFKTRFFAYSRILPL